MRRHRDQVFTGDWEPIVDLATFYALAEALGDSKRRTVRRGVRRHVLTGIARCSLCGQGMGTRIPKPGGGVRYACVNAPGRKGCGRVTILARPVEEIVERIVRESLLISSPGPGEPAIAEAEVHELQTRRADDQSSLEQLARDHYSEHLISRGELLAARTPLQERIAAADRLIDDANVRRTKVITGPAQGSPDNRVIDIEGRRRLITACLEKVVISPAPRPGTHRFDPTRISVVTRAGEMMAVVLTAKMGIALQDRDGRVRLPL